MAEHNSFTYRGYRWDNEIKMYYLNSRNYSPDTSRFINSDGLLGVYGDIQSTNMYAYCANNPVNYIDYNGNISVAFALSMYYPLLSQIIGSLCSFLAAIPVWGWIAIAVVVLTIIIAIGISYAKDKAYINATSLLYTASVSPAPLPPDKGGKGSNTASKTLYNRNGVRLDVENPSGGQGNIHVHYQGGKYYYDIVNRTFSGAPNVVQKLMNSKDFIIAISKALRILGY